MSRTTTEMQLISTDKLVPYVNNARTHSAEQIIKLRSSLREFGFVNPIIIDRDFNVIAGHGRLMAAKEEGINEVPCVFADFLTDAQKKAYILADNRMAMDAGWDEELLKIEMEELQNLGYDLGYTGFDEKELADLFGIDDKEVKDDDFDLTAALEKASFVERGDVWFVGKHKLMCGDATSSEDVAKLSKAPGVGKKTAERIASIERSLKMLKQTEVYQTLVAKKATYVKAPLKMTNVLLKNVNFQYAVKLWNYLSEQMELNDKTVNETSQYEEKGIVKELVDEDIFLLHSIFRKTDDSNTLKGKAKSGVEDNKLAKQLTDAMIERIIELNPDMTEKELNKLISEKILVMKTKKLISLKPIEDRFKERIEKYMIQAKEVRLK